MKHDDDLDRILSDQEEILPSSGFATSVMDAVRREALAPPIAFPWKRALPGLAVLVLALAFAVVEVLAQSGRVAAAPSHLETWRSVLAPVVEAAITAGGHWVGLALLLTFASVKLSKRLVRIA
jgi:hypothetical protein